MYKKNCAYLTLNFVLRCLKNLLSAKGAFLGVLNPLDHLEESSHPSPHAGQRSPGSYDKKFFEHLLHLVLVISLDKNSAHLCERSVLVVIIVIFIIVIHP